MLRDEDEQDVRSFNNRRKVIVSAFSADHRLVIGSDYRTLIIDLETPDKVEKELDYGTYFSDFTSDGKFLVFWDPGGGWPVRTKDWVNLRTETAKKSAFHCCPIETVSVSPDSAMIATMDYQRVLIWAAESGHLLAELTSPRVANDEKCLIHRPAWNMKNGVIYGGDGYDVLEWKISDFSKTSSVKRLKGKIAFGALKSRSTNLQGISTDTFSAFVGRNEGVGMTLTVQGLLGGGALMRKVFR